MDDYNWDNYNWQHNNRGASDPALKTPAASGGAPSQADINRQKRKESIRENERRRAENERRRQEAKQNRQTNVNPAPEPTTPTKDPAGGFIHPALWANPIIAVPVAAASALVSSPTGQAVSSFIYSEKNGEPTVLGMPVFGEPRELTQKEMNEWAMSGVPVAGVTRFGTVAAKSTPAVIKAAGTLDTKFLGGAVAATVAGIGYEANRRGLLDMPEISGNPQAPGEITTPKTPGLPSDLTPGTGPSYELIPHDLMSGRSLQIQPDVKGISNNPLITKTDTAVIGGDSGIGFPSPDAFPKFDDDFFPTSPTTPVLPGDSTKSKSPAKSRDQIAPSSPAPFDFVQPKVPAEVAPQTAPDTSSPGISISVPQPLSPSLTTPVPGTTVQPTTSPASTVFPSTSPTTVPGTTTMPVITPYTPAFVSPITPSSPDYAPSSPAVTVPEYPNDDLTRMQDAFEFTLPTQSRPGRQGRSRKRIDLPDFITPKAKNLSSIKLTKDWYVKNPVPSVIFGKTPKIKMPKPKPIKLPRFKS